MKCKMVDATLVSVAVVIGAMAGLFAFFVILSSRKMDTLKKTAVPSPEKAIIGPRSYDDEPASDPTWDAIEKSRGSGLSGPIPLLLKTVVGFYNMVYIGDSYSCKIFIFNTSKDSAKSKDIMKGLVPDKQEKKFSTETMYAKDQDPVKVKVEILAPNFTISPPSRIVEVPAGGTAISTHLISTINERLSDRIIGKRQAILVNFDQVLGENTAMETFHLGSLDYEVIVEKAVIPVEIHSEIKTQEKIKYISIAAGTVSALVTAIFTALAVIGI